ncbi:unnamed protein product [Phytomonas sp. EM1]|nr:unnamed protein product [Phytomonas sp. EM1]|eukprot:CCW60775.1 unnamed protein product [Phytomonas sp. isolate EM1]
MGLEKPHGESSLPLSTPPSAPSPGLTEPTLVFANSAPAASRASLNHRSYPHLLRRRRSPLPLPPTPYWLASHNNASLELRFTLPTGVYPSMLLRELTKMDVNTPDVVDIDKAPEDRRVNSWNELTSEQQATYRKFLARRRQQRFRTEQPRALSLALLHQHIFRCGGVRNSLLPTLRSYDSVSLPK